MLTHYCAEEGEGEDGRYPVRYVDEGQFGGNEELPTLAQRPLVAGPRRPAQRHVGPG